MVPPSEQEGECIEGCSQVWTQTGIGLWIFISLHHSDLSFWGEVPLKWIPELHKTYCVSP